MKLDKHCDLPRRQVSPNVFSPTRGLPAWLQCGRLSRKVQYHHDHVSPPDRHLIRSCT
jgi:hypothetical protein